MKVSINWLKELVDLNCSIEQLVKLLPLRTIGIKEVTDAFIELDMKGYNRADLLSMRGVAKEVAAITGSRLSYNEPQEANFVWNKQQLPKIEVEVEDVASIYCVAKIDGLKAGKSPQDWAEKLNNSGMRSVNNITDITNLVMLEYGQPLHAFDSSSVTQNMSIEECWDATTHFTTLDHKPKEIKHGDILIKGDGNIIGLGGVMGGENSEVTDKTASIMLEAAIFNPIQIRKTATRLGLQSEAAKRFQHGLTKTRLFQAFDAAIKMYENLGGTLTAISIVEDKVSDKFKIIVLNRKKINELIGVNLSGEQIELFLDRLYFNWNRDDGGGNSWQVTPPYWRLDIEIEEDLIEEVARMYGYEKIPARTVSQSNLLQKEVPIFQIISNLKQKLSDIGLTEVQTYSFYSTPVINALGWNNEKDRYLVKIANPISSETEYLRQNLWPNLLEVLNRNLRKGFKDIAVFEIGKAFNNINGQPSENYRLAIALINGTDNPLAELYQIFQNLGSNLEGCKLDQQEPPAAVKDLFHPKRFVIVEKNSQQIGSLTEVHLKVLNKLGIEKRVAILEIELA